jgi:hypothetical protein
VRRPRPFQGRGRLIVCGAGQLADYYRDRAAEYDAIYAKPERQEDLARLHRLLPTTGRRAPGGLVILTDNRYVEGSNHPITRVGAEGDTYQTRRLADGREFEILKNFPTRAQFTADLASVTPDVSWTDLDYFWLAEVSLR